ncbi:Ribosomal RNA small subunit methyltransferase I [Caloramator mitchellensis]|uniref:Ribosomal RNA small subunit methyltransferase I n=1 Tax=Caloramator mitchellensis TaxID=908809 RepID=A0A0R3K0A3_CALMK|nr:16S rRNA (cytidine(1402)-2'-O)-methyltransferase [Caloramator mitchellensis]KRQ86341.1 Ribosomal RNA small subunit methyltransferase I [Caloramator mitchellensis]
MAGYIYLVATPIGNLGDITLRALEILKSVHFIAAEDTRQTLKLLNHFEIKKPLISYHEHNKYESGEKIIKRVLEGESMALVTDAGTPGISDPGEALVKMAIENDIKVFGIPGPTAFVNALIVSGLNTSRFVFEGFLPVDKKGRRERLEALLDEERTIIFYEAPHKLERTLEDLYKTFGNRKIALCRELTKKYEEIIRCTLKEAIDTFKQKKPLGEFVLILEGLSKEEKEKKMEETLSEISIEEHVKKYIEEGFSKMDAIKKVAKERNIPKSEVYKMVLDI